MGLKIKSNSGGSVELQVDPTLTTDEVIEIDSTGNMGIESGSNANGSWTKLPDGTLITTHTVDISVAQNSAFTDHVPLGYPYSFISTPIITISSVKNYGNAIGHASIQSHNTSNYTARAIRVGTANTSGICRVNIQAIGRWK